MEDLLLHAFILLYLPFAVFGASWLLRYTDGPMDIFLRIREIAGIRYMELYDGAKVVGYVEENPDKKYFGDLLMCFWCVSVWVSMGFCLMILPILNLTSIVFVTVWIGSFGFAGFLHEITRNNG